MRDFDIEVVIEIKVTNFQCWHAKSSKKKGDGRKSNSIVIIIKNRIKFEIIIKDIKSKVENIKCTRTEGSDI